MEASRPAAPASRILVIGAGGYLGRSLCEVLAAQFDLVRMDVAEHQGPGQFFSASVTDRSALDTVCKGCDSVILAHMASTRTDAYEWPDICMDVNVKGTALALEAAARNGIKRVVLISSISVVWGHVQARKFLTVDLPPFPTQLYGMTKHLQEDVARYYHQTHGLEIAVLRPAYILREDSLINKYGEKCHSTTWQGIDPRDIASAAAGALMTQNLAFEIFYLMAGPGAEIHADIERTRRRLGWNPKHRFEGLTVEQI